MNGLVVRAPTICVSSVKLSQDFHNHLYPSKFFRTRTYPKCRCIKNKDTQNVSEALSLVALQTLELIGVLLLLRCPGKPQYKLRDFFQEKRSAKERNWLFVSALGFGFLVLLVFTTSIIVDWLIGTKEVNNPILKEILSSGPISITSCILVYCIITPSLEEIVYRGFFLTALSSTMKWQQAVIVSSVVFSAAHFSAENFIQLFIIGLILGCCYCWSGDLRSSIIIHSLYNALTLLITYAS
ncbi:uncharacterized protein LOC107815947 isoform X3 [Nicotiana tabacum]|uniref:Uncharacterized protein LOC107815947 isoform X3 n=1 Tax=Nicotiana tabacum TaxID=4097 RepID=A0A1S4C7G0_TOBAC|nr:PREDICTED: uncharacterized protein LOC107815947 isoform X3 [Nicotiana tabacum]